MGFKLRTRVFVETRKNRERNKNRTQKSPNPPNRGQSEGLTERSRYTSEHQTNNFQKKGKRSGLGERREPGVVPKVGKLSQKGCGGGGASRV